MTLRLRRTVLFTPGTRADRWAKALDGPADVAVVDLEDGVPPARKAQARQAVVAALRATTPGRVERGVRLNAWSSPWAREDLEAVAPLQPDLLALPKVESLDEVLAVDEALRALGCQAGLLLLFETAAGVLRAPALAGASERVRAVAFGAEDYAASVGARRTPEGLEVLYARSRVVAAAAAAGVDAVDQVYTRLDDAVGLERDARFGAQLGYRGKMVVHPQQVVPVHAAYRPSSEDVTWARKVREAVAKAGAEEGGVVVVDGAMVDRPLRVQAERLLALDAAAP